MDKELVWIDKNLEGYFDVIQDICRLKGGNIDELLDKLKQDDKLIEENMEENLIDIKHHAKRIRNEYESCVNEQIEKTYKLWEDCDNKIAESRTKIKDVNNLFYEVNDSIKNINDKISNMPIYQLEKAMDILERFKNFSDSDKKKIKILFDMDES